ncbi:MAG: histidine kinase, partial [Crocinitomicaceae bacterium]
SILAFDLPDSLIETERRRFESVYLDKHKTLHICPKGMGYFTLSENGDVKEIIGKSSGINGYGVKKVDNKWLQFSITQPNSSQETFVHLDRNNSVKRISEDIANGRYRSSIVQYKDGTVLFSNGGHEVIEFRNNLFIKKHSFDYQVVSLFIDRKENLWIGSFGAGIYRTGDRTLTNFDHFCGNDAAGVVTEDKDGGIWFKSNTVGFGYLSPTSVPHYSAQNGHEKLAGITRLFVGNDLVVVQNNLGDVLTINDQNEIENITEQTNLFKFDMQTLTQGICYDAGTNKLVLIRGNKLWIWQNSEWKGLSYGAGFFEQRSVGLIQSVGKSRIVGLAGNQLFEVKGDSLIVISKPSNEPITNICLSDNDELLVTRKDGIWKLENERFVPFLKDNNSIFKDGVVAIKSINGTIWVQPQSHPLVRIMNGRFETVVDQNGKELQLSGLGTAPNGDIWACLYPEYGTMCRISHKNDSYDVNYFTYDEMATKGYFGDGIGISDEFLYFGSFFGFYKAKIKDLKPFPTPITIVPRFYINAELTELQSSYNLSHDENNITVTFDAISFLRTELEYQYLMIGLDDEWQTISASEIRFINLKPGSYELKLRAKTKNGFWQDPIVFPIEISKPYWQTWWFRIAMILLISLLIFSIFRWRIKRAKNKEKEKSKVALELARLEMRALKAQINPHFIFNSITSAMFYLAKNENQKVESYLQRFSKLVRRVLESSDKSLISLAEEMELINLYVKLESEQFDGEPISLDVSYEGDGIERAQIPPTLIQPYIENAIHHGLRNKRDKRIIKLSFSVIKGELKIQILDNGVGRAEARKITPFKENKSFGMLISSRRIELLNKNKISHVQVDDLIDENGNALGTQVSFNIPYITDSPKLRAIS